MDYFYGSFFAVFAADFKGNQFESSFLHLDSGKTIAKMNHLD
jgi:hypothetical protein